MQKIRRVHFEHMMRCDGAKIRNWCLHFMDIDEIRYRPPADGDPTALVVTAKRGKRSSPRSNEQAVTRQAGKA